MVATIEARIPSGVARPGTCQVERRVAEGCGVSGTPVRAALLHLIAKGLTSENGRGSAMVRQPPVSAAPDWLLATQPTSAQVFIPPDQQFVTRIPLCMRGAVNEHTAMAARAVGTLDISPSGASPSATIEFLQHSGVLGKTLRQSPSTLQSPLIAFCEARVQRAT
ncbi:MAG: GntR family transcriptional regulator [Tabrizicola sp.]|nr:GntR family transcriptional regulator [Tabrizicola sp.]